MFVKGADVGDGLAERFDGAGVGARCHRFDELGVNANLVQSQRHAVKLFCVVDKRFVAAGANRFDDLGDPCQEVGVHLQRARANAFQRRAGGL